MPTAAILSFRLGGRDGVSVEAAKWQWALEQLGVRVFTVAGEGKADVILPGLAIEAAGPPGQTELADALSPADLVIVENLCSLPLNPAAMRVVTRVLAGRRALLHHHDLPWQRPRFESWARPVPHDAAWTHVTINELSRRQLAERGLLATTIYNAFDTEAAPGDRDATRALLGLEQSDVVVLQPTRAIARKGIPDAVALAEALGAVYWLLGPAEEGYDDELASVFAHAKVRVVHGDVIDGRGVSVVDAYAACDVVAFPSTWEGFGNPTVESAVHRRPLAINRYPVATEIAGFGFRWFGPDDAEGLRRFLDRPDEALLDHNLAVARRFFSLPGLVERLGQLLERTMWKTTL